MKKRYIVLVITLLLVAAGWIWRYNSLNKYYKDISADTKKVIYDIGDVVPFEDDRMEGWKQANGYSLKVDRFEIVDSQDFIDMVGFIPNDAYFPCEKIAVVYITLFNEESDAAGIMLTELSLYGIDQVLNLNWDLLLAANPILEGNMGIKLAHNSECSLILPFSLFEKYFSGATWNNIDDYELFLELTIYPAQKKVKVQ